MRSAMYLGAILALFAATAGASRMMGEASAPAPAGMHHKHHPWPAMAPGPAGYSGCEKHHEEHDEQNDADLTFVLSADQAEFTAANTLQLTRVSTSVQYHDSYKHGASAGIVRTPVFTNSTPGSHYVDASGAWLNSPDAALIGDANNSDSSNAVLLALSNPMYDAATQSVSFTVNVLPANQSELKLHKGVCNGLIWQQKNGNGTPLVTAVTPGATLTNVALFIDSNKQALHPAAAAEDWDGRDGGWGRGGDGWGRGGGWNGGGWGWNGGWGGGWNGGWGSGISISFGRR